MARTSPLRAAAANCASAVSNAAGAFGFGVQVLGDPFNTHNGVWLSLEERCFREAEDIRSNRITYISSKVLPFPITEI